MPNIIRGEGHLLRSMSGVGLAWFTGLFTDPCFATLAWDLDSLGRLTPDPGRQGLGAERHTSNCPIHTHTTVLTIGLEALAITVNHTVVLTACSHNICTHSFFVPRLVSTVVTVKPFMIVTGISFITGLSHLLGTGLAAVTSICQQADPMWANRGTLGTLTWPFAVPSSIIRV